MRRRGTPRVDQARRISEAPFSSDSPGIAASRCIADPARNTDPGEARHISTTGGSEWPNDHLPVAIGGLIMRNRHIPRLCVACEAPLGSQDGACWRCGSRPADRHEQRAEPERQTESDADRWTDEGGALVMEESSSVPPVISPSDASEPLPKVPRQMAANVVFQVHDGRGAEMLAELEERTSHRSTVTPSGERKYELSAAEVGVGGFDPILGLIDTDWRGHLSRTQLPTKK